MNYHNSIMEVTNERHESWLPVAPSDPEKYQRWLAKGYKIGHLALSPDYLAEQALAEPDSDVRRDKATFANEANLNLGGIEAGLVEDYGGAVIAMQTGREALPPEEQHQYAADARFIALLISPTAFSIQA